jgi:hypothetical protein
VGQQEVTHIRTKLKPEELVDVLFVWHEAMRRLGFTADEVFVMYGIQDPQSAIICWGIKLKVAPTWPTGAPLEWHASVGTTTESEKAFLARWNAFVEHDQKHLSDERGSKLWQKYMPIALFEQLAATLMTAGMPLRSFQS